MNVGGDDEWYLLPRAEKGDHFPGKIDAVERIRVRDVPRDALELNEACRVSPDDPPLTLLVDEDREFQRLTVESQSADENKVSFDVWHRVL
jgi:hypothetical protein